MLHAVPLQIPAFAAIEFLLYALSLRSQQKLKHRRSRRAFPN